MNKYVKGAAEVVGVLLIATLTYDWLTADCFKKSHTYRCFKSIKKSKTCRTFLKRFKKRRKRCWRRSFWPLYDTPLKNAVGVNQTSLAFGEFGFTWPELKDNTVSLIQEVVTHVEKKFPSLQPLISLLAQNFIKVAADSVKIFSQYIKKYTVTVTEYTTKIVRHYQH